jgi:hypothetical protein
MAMPEGFMLCMFRRLMTTKQLLPAAEATTDG